MDPLSALFAGYLNAVADGMAGSITDAMDAEPVTVTAELHGQSVTFQHQRWRIKPETVCLDQRHGIDVFSRCTRAAKQLFQLACEDLTATPRRHPNYRSMARMYCTAGARFTPTQASVEWAGSAPAAAETEDCRLAKAMLVVENTPATRAQRQEACGR
jgi:hypothetical protein